VCATADPDAPVAIAQPGAGAHFVLEPHRPPQAQRPPLAAQPAVADLRWTIDGEPAERWIPRPGPHHVEVAHGHSTAAVDITYE